MEDSIPIPYILLTVAYIAVGMLIVILRAYIIRAKGLGSEAPAYFVLWMWPIYLIFTILNVIVHSVESFLVWTSRLPDMLNEIGRNWAFSEKEDHDE